MDFESASFHIGATIDSAKAKELFNGRIYEFSDKWYLTGFIKFQYNVLPKDLSENNNVHKSVINILKKEALWQGLTSPLQGAMDKDKDKDKDINKDKDISMGEDINLKDVIEKGLKESKSLYDPNKKAKDYTAQDLFGYFCHKYHDFYGIKYMASFSRDTKIFKDILGFCGRPEIVYDCLNIMFERAEDGKWESDKISPTIFRSKINEYRAQLIEETGTSKKYFKQ